MRCSTSVAPRRSLRSPVHSLISSSLLPFLYQTKTLKDGTFFVSHYGQKLRISSGPSSVHPCSRRFYAARSIEHNDSASHSIIKRIPIRSDRPRQRSTKLSSSDDASDCSSNGVKPRFRREDSPLSRKVQSPPREDAADVSPDALKSQPWRRETLSSNQAVDIPFEKLKPRVRREERPSGGRIVDDVPFDDVKSRYRREESPSLRHGPADIPFDNPKPRLRMVEQSRPVKLQAPSGPRTITLTDPEKKVFERIFKDLELESNGTSKKVDSDNSNAAIDPGIPVSAPLGNHLDHLIATHEKSVPVLESSRHHTSHLTLRQESSEDPTTAPAPTPEEVFSASSAHLSSHMSAIEAAPTDAAIWSLLKTKVFPLINALLPLKSQENTASVSSPTRMSSRRERRTERRKALQEAASAGHNDAALDAKATSTDSPSQVQELLSPALLAALPSLLSSLLLQTIRHLRTYFPLSYYPYILLPHLRSISPLALILCTSTPLYNELLFLTYVQRNSLHGLISLLDEMRDQGIEGDEVTIGLLTVIRKQRHKDLKLGAKWEERNKTGNGEKEWRRRLWWEMEPNKEAWVEILERISMLTREIETKAMEMEARTGDSSGNGVEGGGEADGDGAVDEAGSEDAPQASSSIGASS